MTRLANDPQLWDQVFRPSAEQVRFAHGLIRRPGQRVLDVGCATGTLCAALAEGQAIVTGLDVNTGFIAAAQDKCPVGTFHVGDMRKFDLQQRFDVLLCLGSTFCYNLDNQQITATLRCFRRHLRPGGTLAIDVLNAIALLGPRPFRAIGEHRFKVNGKTAVARIRHALHLKQQWLTEQVSWKFAEGPWHRDPVEPLRLLFPQELAFHLECAGFEVIELIDRYGDSTQRFGGRRLIAIARRRLR